MALIIVSELEPSPRDVTLPANVDFMVTIRDDEAGDEPQSHTLTLRLAESNDLSFEPTSGGAKLKKTKAFTRTIPATPKDLTFSARIHGEGTGLGSFRVSLDVPGTSGTGCLVGLS